MPECQTAQGQFLQWVGDSQLCVKSTGLVGAGGVALRL